MQKSIRTKVLSIPLDAVVVGGGAIQCDFPWSLDEVGWVSCKRISGLLFKLVLKFVTCVLVFSQRPTITRQRLEFQPLPSGLNTR